MNDAPAPDPAEARQRQAWHLNLRWIAGLLAVWFVVTFVVAWFARELRFDFFGWPFSFWVGAQGALVVYVLMIALYAWRMNRADESADVADAPAPLPSQGALRGPGSDAA
ncbi:putative solute:sodium symporter small subunit [compost metagenome]